MPTLRMPCMLSSLILCLVSGTASLPSWYEKKRATLRGHRANANDAVGDALLQGVNFHLDYVSVLQALPDGDMRRAAGRKVATHRQLLDDLVDQHVGGKDVNDRVRMSDRNDPQQGLATAN